MTTEQRILVVDDDDAIRALLQTILRRRRLRVDEARNGFDALEQLAARPYVLVVLDLMMPRMSGYDVLDHLSRQPVASRPRVLVLTAGLDSHLPYAFPADLVIGTVHKPFDVAMLVDIVTSLLSTPSPHDETAELTGPN